jgi:hypothetical protein
MPPVVGVQLEPAQGVESIEKLDVEDTSPIRFPCTSYATVA